MASEIRAFSMIDACCNAKFYICEREKISGVLFICWLARNETQELESGLRKPDSILSEKCEYSIFLEEEELVNVGCY